MDELKTPVAKEKECLEFLGIKESKFDYCKIGAKGSKGVVAVIGDSHAHVAFPGISEGLEEYGLTTILLANSSCPPFLGSPWGRNKDEKNSCSERIDEIISNVQTLQNLDSVILFTRGQYDESKRWCNKVLLVKPWHFEVGKLLVALQLRQDEFSQALITARRYTLPSLNSRTNNKRRR